MTRRPFRVCVVGATISVVVASMAAAGGVARAATAASPRVASQVVPALPVTGSSVVAAGRVGAALRAVATAAPAVLPASTVVAPSPAPKASGVKGFDPLLSKVVSRAATSTVWANTDGTQTVQSSRSVINYLDGAGKWLPVDNTVVADPDVAGGFVSRANAWRAHFSSAGVVLETSVGSVAVTAFGADLSSPSVSATGDGVTYKQAWPGVDLSYRVTGEGVKESVVLSSASVRTSFQFRVRSGALGVLRAGGGSDVGLGAVRADGSMPLAGALGSLVSIAAPVVLRADGEPQENTGASLVSVGGFVVLSVSPVWLAAQPGLRPEVWTRDLVVTRLVAA